MPRLTLPVRRTPQVAWLFTVPLSILAVGLTFALQLPLPIPPRDWYLAILFFGLFLVADATVMRFEIRRQAITVTVAEVPLLIGLFYLSPLLLVTVRAAAAAITRARRGREQASVKLWFNVASVAASVAVSKAIVIGLEPSDAAWDLRDPTTWLVLCLAVAAGVLITMVSVVGVITLVNGRASNRDIARATVPGLIVTGVNITVGLAALLVIKATPWGIVLLAVLVIVFVVAYRSYAQFVQQHRTLSEMYDLMRGIRDARYSGMLADALLHRLREMLRAEHATLWLPVQARFPEVLHTAQVDASGLLDTPGSPDPLRRLALERGETVALTAKLGDPQLLARMRSEGLRKDAIVVPLRSGDAVIGTLDVSGRLNDAVEFDPNDVRLMETVAAHVAVAVENSRLVDRLRFDAAHDALTGLANRRRLTAALEESVGVRAPGEMVALLLFDVAGLRQVNESLGHAAGDQVLVEVARRLRASAPSSALVGRIGGDEFAVTLRVDSSDSALGLAKDLRNQVRDQMVFGTLTLDVDTAVGVVVHPDHGSEPATLIQRADLATTAAKTVPGSIQLYNPGLESRSVRRLALAGDLRRAIDNDELDVYFQPKVTLGDRRLIGVECLARWEHPAHGSVPPEDFVAVAEHTGQLGHLTEAVLKEGLRRCRDWSATNHPLSIAVNLSTRTLTDPDFPTRVQELLGEYGVPPHRLTFEIKEEGVLDGTDRPMPTLHRLRDIGVRLSVDDFGTGYSSLSYLRRLPVHEVKVDRSFVQGMATDPGDLAIVNAVVTLSQQFGLTVVAEGVESELTLELLQDIGCEVGQGFLFSRPLPYERLEAWFAARTESEPAQGGGEVRRLRAVT
ncbi:MAG TPA: sensor domain-containing phosphodiesterase [Asanoa sp.]